MYSDEFHKEFLESKSCTPTISARSLPFSCPLISFQLVSFISPGSLLFPCQVSLLLKNIVSVMTNGAIEPLCNESLPEVS